MVRMPNPIQISQQQARRFLLAHHMLWPPRRLRGKGGVLDYLARVGCIQFDTINVITRNADLVLQARVRGYQPGVLEEMLYQDRSLWDGWDKVASIYPATDWPHFEPQRQRMRAQYADQTKSGGKLEVAAKVREAVQARGPLSSLDIDHDEKLAGRGWGGDTRAARASLEALYAMGELGVHSRVNTRRNFDLVERLLPSELLSKSHAHKDLNAYHDWHVLRRIGGLGLAQSRGTDHWLGISHLKAQQKYAALERLEAAGLVQKVNIDRLDGEPLFIRAADLATLEAVSGGRQPTRQAAFIAPLDNLVWQRRLLEKLFSFHYRWEVYVPAAKRQFGYYVLPVLYGDRFVARVDPKLDREAAALTVQNWWWETDVDVHDEHMLAAIANALGEFMAYLGARQLEIGPEARRVPMIESLADSL